MVPQRSVNLNASNSVPIAVAELRTENWRIAVEKLGEEQGLSKAAKPLLPHAVFIPLDDILALAQKYELQHGKKIAGARAYFALLEPDFKSGIRLLLVPVVEEKESFVSTYRDLIVETTIHDGTSKSTETSVYDFTKPCPDFCDGDSPLYKAKL